MLGGRPWPGGFRVCSQAYLVPVETLRDFKGKPF